MKHFIKHLNACVFFALMHLPMKGQWRAVFAKLGGIKLVLWHRTFIGTGVIFDTVYPENIEIEAHVHITARCVFLTHYLNTAEHGIFWKSGIIHVGRDTFIGTGTIITKPCRIGRNVIIGAGSVVTKDIPDNEIWAGNPARFIKKRETVATTSFK